MNAWSWVILAALALQLVIQAFLTQRHRRCIQRHRDEVPGEFHERIPLRAHQKAADYTRAKTQLNLVELVWAGGLLLLFTLGGGLQTLDAGLRRMEWPPLQTGVCFLLLFWGLYALLALPPSLYRTFRLEQRFGFNRSSAGLFCRDLAKQVLIGVIIGTPLFALLLWLMQDLDSNPWWWLHVWGVWILFSLFMTWCWPSFIAPLFNKFRPLQDDLLRQRLERLLDRNGFSSRGIYVMDGSARSTHGNAYFTGLGSSKRIVFFDTLVEQLEHEEIEAVIAHELGHFKCNHIKQRLLILAVLSLVGMAVLGWLIDRPWFYLGLGVEQPSSHQALALFALAMPLFLFFLQPVFSFLSRCHEFEADHFAASQAPVQSLCQALIKLYRDNANTLTPDAWYSAFHDSHPPALTRIQHLRPATVR